MSHQQNNSVPRMSARLSLDARIQAHAPLMRQQSTGSLSGGSQLGGGDMMDLDTMASFPACGDNPYNALAPRGHSQHLDGTTASRLRYERAPTPHSDHGLSRMLTGAHGPFAHTPGAANMTVVSAMADQRAGLVSEGSRTGEPEVPSPVPAAAPAPSAAPQGEGGSPSANLASLVPCIRAATDRGVGQEGMERLLKFTGEDDVHIKLDLLMVQLLVLEQRQQNVEREIAATRASSEKMLDFVQASFQLTKEQMAALRRLIGHMAAQPLPGGYGKQNFVQACMEYIANKRGKFGFKKFVSDEVIKSAAEAFLNQWVSNDKSEYRKEIFKLFDKNLTLDDLVNAIMKMVHLTPRPATYDTSIYAFVALFRKIAMPLLPNSKGTRDTKYWKKLDAELASLVQKFGTENLQADCWRWWMSEIIAEDRNTYRPLERNHLLSLEEDNELPEPELDEDPEGTVIVPAMNSVF